MEFKFFFSTLKKRISDGYDVPQFFRDLFAMITDVPEEEWGTPLDPSTNKVTDESLRSYAKRKIPKKFAQNIVYRLSKENFLDSVNSRPEDARELLADDFKSYDSELDSDNIAEWLADLFVEIIREAAGLVKQGDLEKQKQQQLAINLKNQYGNYLLNEVNRYCPFPGCGQTLTQADSGKTIDIYEVGMIDKTKAPEISNLLALCPQCYGTYSLDTSKKFVKQLAQVKKLLENNMNSKSIIDVLPLEKGITGVLTKVKNLKQTDFENASLEPKEIRQKISPAEDFVLYTQVNLFVSTYFIRIREIMTNLDKQGVIDYEIVQDQMKAIYKKLKKAKKTKMEIFNTIADKVHHVSLQEDVYCQIVVSYFVQSCEVFEDAITK